MPYVILQPGCSDQRFLPSENFVVNISTQYNKLDKRNFVDHEVLVKGSHRCLPNVYAGIDRYRGIHEKGSSQLFVCRGIDG